MINQNNKAPLTIGVIILSAFGALALYQYLVVTPGKNMDMQQRAAELKLQQDCMKSGREYAEKYEEGLKTNYALPKTIIRPIFHFNKTMRTCLVETGEITYYSTGNFSTYKFILDLYTNAILASHTYDEETKYDHPEVWTQDRNYYEERKVELFELPELPKLPVTNQPQN